MRVGGSRAGADPDDSTYRWWQSTNAEQDQPTIPLGRRWHMAGTVVGAIIVLFVVTVVLAEDDTEPIDYQAVLPVAVETDAVGEPIVTNVYVQIDPALPREGRVRVAGDGIVRVEVDGDAFCTGVSGAAGAWIDVRFCRPLDTLEITATSDDDETTTAIARF